MPKHFDSCVYHFDHEYHHNQNHYIITQHCITIIITFITSIINNLILILILTISNRQPSIINELSPSIMHHLYTYIYIYMCVCNTSIVWASWSRKAMENENMFKPPVCFYKVEDTASSTTNHSLNPNPMALNLLRLFGVKAPQKNPQALRPSAPAASQPSMLETSQWYPRCWWGLAASQSWDKSSWISLAFQAASDNKN